jgi:hypothetical protein
MRERSDKGGITWNPLLRALFPLESTYYLCNYSTLQERIASYQQTQGRTYISQPPITYLQIRMISETEVAKEVSHKTATSLQETAHTCGWGTMYSDSVVGAMKAVELSHASGLTIADLLDGIVKDGLLGVEAEEFKTMIMCFGKRVRHLDGCFGDVNNGYHILGSGGIDLSDLISEGFLSEDEFDNVSDSEVAEDEDGYDDSNFHGVDRSGEGDKESGNTTIAEFAELY